MTPSQFKAAYLAVHPNSYYFTRATMGFYGDTMANYKIVDHGNYWELSRKRPVRGTNQASVFFTKDTFEQSNTPPPSIPGPSPCSGY